MSPCDKMKQMLSEIIGQHFFVAAWWLPVAAKGRNGSQPRAQRLIPLRCRANLLAYGKRDEA